jgi:hypothetical protein
LNQEVNHVRTKVSQKLCMFRSFHNPQKTERADFTTGKPRQWLQAPTSIGGLPPTDNRTSSLAVVVKAYTLLVETSPWPVQLALNVCGPMRGSGVPSPQSEFPVWLVREILVSVRLT